MGICALAPQFRLRRALAMLVAAVLSTILLAPAQARADGPLTPAATFYLARISHVPAGIQAKIVDGYLSLWVKADPGYTVTVLDFRGAPWVRIDRAGVEVNHNSEEYYLSQVPVPAVPPTRLTRTTPPHWVKQSSGRSYMWREGRLHAFATVAIAPGSSFAGNWKIPVLVDGRSAAITGGLWHRGSPSIVWFWPIVVLLACILAAWRLRSSALDRRLSRAVALTLLLGIAVGMAARELHGRPTVTAVNVVVLAAVLAAAAVAAARLIGGRGGVILSLATALVALWVGLTLLPVLTHGYVLLAVPALVARVTTVVLLGGSLGLALITRRARPAQATGDA